MKNHGSWGLAAVLVGTLAMAAGAQSGLAQARQGGGGSAQEQSPLGAERGRRGAQELEPTRPLTGSGPAAGARKGDDEDKVIPVAAEVRAVAATGTVTGIDRENRTVMLSDDSGEEVSVQIPPGAAGFDQLKVGDRVDVTFLQPLELGPPADEAEDMP